MFARVPTEIGEDGGPDPVVEQEHDQVCGYPHQQAVDDGPHGERLPPEQSVHDLGRELFEILDHDRWTDEDCTSAQVQIKKQRPGKSQGRAAHQSRDGVTPNRLGQKPRDQKTKPERGKEIDHQPNREPARNMLGGAPNAE